MKRTPCLILEVRNNLSLSIAVYCDDTDSCQGHGTCNPIDGTCQCNTEEGYFGDHCEKKRTKKGNIWNGLKKELKIDKNYEK